MLTFAEEVTRRGGQVTQVRLRCIDDDVMSLTKRYGDREGIHYAKFYQYEK